MSTYVPKDENPPDRHRLLDDVSDTSSDGEDDAASDSAQSQAARPGNIDDADDGYDEDDTDDDDGGAAEKVDANTAAPIALHPRPLLRAGMISSNSTVSAPLSISASASASSAPALASAQPPGGNSMIGAYNYMNLLQQNQDLRALVTLQAQLLSSNGAPQAQRQQPQMQMQPQPQQLRPSPQPPQPIVPQPILQTAPSQHLVSMPNGTAVNGDSSVYIAPAPKQFTFQNVNANGDGIDRTPAGIPAPMPMAVQRPMPVQTQYPMPIPQVQPLSAVGISNSSTAAAVVLTSHLPTILHIDNCSNSNNNNSNGFAQQFGQRNHAFPQVHQPHLQPQLLPVPVRPPNPPTPPPPPASWGVPPPSVSTMDELSVPFIVGQTANSPNQQTIVPDRNRNTNSDERDGCCLFVCMTGVCAGLYAFLKCC